MKYPKLSGSYTARAHIKNLSGGLNLSLPKNQIPNFDQSEIKNMFYNRGLLKKRPGLKLLETISGYTATDCETKDGIFIYKKDIDKGIGYFYGASVSKTGVLTEYEPLKIEEKYEYASMSDAKLCYCFFPFSSNNTLYLAIGYNNEVTGFLGEVYVLKNGAFSLLNDGDIYAPLVMINGKGNKFSSLPVSENAVYSPASPFEGINLLTRRIRVQYTTDGASYSFPFTIKRKPQTPVTVKLTGAFDEDDDIQEISFTFKDESEIVNMPYNSEITCFIQNYNCITFREPSTDTKKINRPPIASSFSNNLEIEYTVDENPNEKSFFEMGLFTPFGASGGSGKGNRIFVAGNKNQKNILRYSDLNNPLYFPENNFVYVSDGEILSLKRQGSMLLIFSDKEIHYASYLGGEFTAEDIISGNIIDVSNASALFPITQLHANLGLKHKNAAFVLDNKTIFLGSDNRIYSVESPEYIKHLSYKIDDYLKDIKTKFVAMGSYLDYLLLFCDNEIVAYNKKSDSFYIWQEKIKTLKIYGSLNDPIIISSTGILSFDEETDFDFSFSTGEFDLNYPEKKKRILKATVIGDGGYIKILKNGKNNGVYMPILKGEDIYLNVLNAKSISFTLKNCNNFEGIIFYYNVN